MSNKKKKKTEINNGNPLFMIDRLNAYKWIKFCLLYTSDAADE